MKVTRIIIFIISFLIASFAFADINYHINHNGSNIHIKANFGICNNNHIKLYVPDNIWGVDYSRQIKNIQVKNGIYNSKDSSVNYNKNENLEIEYDIVNIPKDEFADDFGDKYYHYFDKEKFFLFGLGLFIYPEYFENQDVMPKVTIQIDSTAKKVFSDSSFFYKGPIITDLNGIGRIILLGNQDFYYSNNENIKVIVWNRDQKLGQRIEKIALKILKQHKEFWNQNNNSEEIAIFMQNPFKLKSSNYGGTALKGKRLVVFFDQNVDDNDLYKIINHEGLHFWFGSNLIRGPKWFTEGFVDYYMDKIDYHYSNNIQQFIDNYNKKLFLYFALPFQSIDSKTIEEKFFSINAVQKLPYLKGYLIAGQIDSAVNLDLVLKNIIKDCQKDKKYCEFSEKLVLDYISHDKRSVVNKLFNQFNESELLPSFLSKASLFFKQIDLIEYKIDIKKIINDGFISGSYLNKLDKKYNKHISYKLYNIFRRNDESTLRFFIKNNEKIEEFFPIKDLQNLRIPTYKIN